MAATGVMLNGSYHGVVTKTSEVLE